MKKGFSLILIFIVVFSLFALSTNNNFSSLALESGQTATVIASRCLVYEHPDFSSNQTMVEIEGEAQPLKLTHKQEVEILDLEGDFAKIKTANNIEGYVYKYYLTQNTPQQVYPVFNARIRSDTILFDLDYQNSGYALTKDDRVFVYKSFSEKKEYTAVQVVLEDQSLYNGYVLTKDVAPDGISGILIAGISIIAAAVTIVLAIVFMKKKKKK